MTFPLFHLQITLRRSDAPAAAGQGATEQYTASMVLDSPRHAELLCPVTGRVHLDLNALTNLARQWDGAGKNDHQQAVEYGWRLTRRLFHDVELRERFQLAMTLTAQAAGARLRIQLCIDNEVPELHEIRWESLLNPADLNWLLADPDSGEDSIDPDLPADQEEIPWLLANEIILFSRLIYSNDLRLDQSRARDKLRALVGIADPQATGLARVQVELEVEHVQESLKGLRVDVLTAKASDRVSLETLIARLQDGYDILYLICHGRRNPLQTGTELALENAAGGADWVSGKRLANRLNALRHRPRLVVLTACHGGEGLTTDGVLAAVGPCLASEGIPAVLAMQGPVRMETARAFFGHFFSQLPRSGGEDGLQIDSAVASARTRMAERLDRWMPVLFTRLKEGRLRWYDPSFSDANTERRWQSILDSIEREKCTPILGPAVSEALYGSIRAVACRVAKKWNFPLGEHWHEHLSRVTHFLEIMERQQTMLSAVQSAIQDQLWDRHRHNFPPSLTSKSLFMELLSAAGKVARQSPDDPYQVLAGLPFSLYLVANPDPALEDALCERRSRPITKLKKVQEFIQLLEQQLTQSVQSGVAGGNLLQVQADLRKVQDSVSQALLAGSDIILCLRSAREGGQSIAGALRLLANRLEQPGEPLPSGFENLKLRGEQLNDALDAAWKSVRTLPRRELYRWKEDNPDADPINWGEVHLGQDSSYTPSLEEPLVYHPFGHWQHEQTVVLTEDQFLDYLIHMGSSSVEMPTTVKEALSDRSLLFIGFEMDDWSLRILLRYILSRGGSRKLRRHPHVAVQLDPDRSRHSDPKQAREFFEKSLGGQAAELDIAIFWGTVEDFTRELRARWRTHTNCDVGNKEVTR